MRNSHAVSFFVLALMSSGCGQVEHAEVTGKVTLNGTPMNNVRLSFMGDPRESPNDPLPLTGNFAPFTFAFTDDEGNFRLRTAEGNDGAVLGTYTVVLKDMGANGKERPRVPMKYAYAARTPLRRIIVDSGTNELNFELEPDGRRSMR